MLVKFFHHGVGTSDSAMAYLLSEAPFKYLAGPRDGKGAVRQPAPVVVRGNANNTRQLINQLRTKKHHYVSGVLSFKEMISPKAEQRIIDRFESVAFAGLKRSQFDCCWIRHNHNGRSELHFLTPRCELSTGKALNIRPPRREAEELFDTFRMLINYEYQLAEPMASVGHLAPTQVAALQVKLDRLTEARAKYNRQRYPAPAIELPPELRADLYENRTGPTRRGTATARTAPGRAHEPGGVALERLSRATRAISAADAYIEHASKRFSDSAQTVGNSAGKTLALFRRRSLGEAIVNRYAIAQTSGREHTSNLNRDDVDLEFDLGGDL